jgi:hypothetical protein
MLNVQIVVRMSGYYHPRKVALFVQVANLMSSAWNAVLQHTYEDTHFAMFWLEIPRQYVTYDGVFRITIIRNILLTKTNVQMTKAYFVREITEIDPDTKLPVELELYKHENGGMFAVDSSYLDQVARTDDYDRPIIPDPLSDVLGEVILFD